MKKRIIAALLMCLCFVAPAATTVHADGYGYNNAAAQQQLAQYWAYQLQQSLQALAYAQQNYSWCCQHQSGTLVARQNLYVCQQNVNQCKYQLRCLGYNIY